MSSVMTRRSRFLELCDSPKSTHATILAVQVEAFPPAPSITHSLVEMTFNEFQPIRAIDLGFVSTHGIVLVTFYSASAIYRAFAKFSPFVVATLESPPALPQSPRTPPSSTSMLFPDPIWSSTVDESWSSFYLDKAPAPHKSNCLQASRRSSQDETGSFQSDTWSCLIGQDMFNHKNWTEHSFEPDSRVCEARKMPKIEPNLESMVMKTTKEQRLPASDDQSLQIHIPLIMRRVETRTTCMLMNVPNRMTLRMLQTMVDRHVPGMYTFLHLPASQKPRLNVGYAFINMVDPMAIITLHKAFHLQGWKPTGDACRKSSKECHVVFARVQGICKVITHLARRLVDDQDFSKSLDKVDAITANGNMVEIENVLLSKDLWNHIRAANGAQRSWNAPPIENKVFSKETIAF